MKKELSSPMMAAIIVVFVVLVAVVGWFLINKAPAVVPGDSTGPKPTTSVGASGQAPATPNN
jgi:hypothetical protein